MRELKELFEKKRLIGEERLAYQHSIINNVVAAKQTLNSLLDFVNENFNGPDGVYRYYHGSFKVLYLQGITIKMVEALASLAPDYESPYTPPDQETDRVARWSRDPLLAEICPEFKLTSQFMSVIKAGTGKVFDHSMNAAWEQETLPVVHAFLHARFMLEVAVSCEPWDGGLLPSGIALILSLYDMR